MPAPIIQLQQLRKEFGELVAVEDLDLEIAEGEFLCFLGPSGCGKTTTLRMIAGLETPTAGEVYLRGVRITRLPPQQRNVGFMFQNYALFWHMTVYDNLAFGLRVRGMPAEAMRAKILEVAGDLELEDLLQVKAAKLDLSAMQRVAMARVLAIEPEVLLLDEPLNNFRPGLREIMRGELKRSQRQLGRTMVYVTHDQEEAMTLGDRILVMSDGRCEQLDTPETVYALPANLFVAGFIGRPAMNFLEMHYTREDEHAYLTRNGLRIEVTAMKPILEEAGDLGRLIAGIRPQHIAPANGSSDQPTLSAEVDLVQPLARKKIVDLKADGESLKMVVPARTRIARGDRLQVVLPTSQLHLFEPQTGKAIR